MYCYFIIIFPWKREGPLIWTNLNPLHPRMLCAWFGWNGPMVLEKRIFKSINVFWLFRYYLPLKKAEPLIWTNLNPLHLRMLCTKFGWNWPSGSGVEDENVKSLHRWMDRWTTGDQKNSFELSSQVIWKQYHNIFLKSSYPILQYKFYNKIILCLHECKSL